MTTRDDWSGCDNEAQESVRYAILDYMTECKKVMDAADERGLGAIMYVTRQTGNAARAALMVLEDLADGSAVAVPASQSVEIARLKAELEKVSVGR